MPSGRPSRAIEGVQLDRRGTLMLSRVDKSPVATWWWTVDRWFLAAFLSLMGLGIVLSFAASPAVAERIGLDSFHFATRQIIFTIPALARCWPSPSSTRGRSGAWPLIDAVRLAGADGGGALRRRRGEGRAALGVARRRVDPAVRIPEAGLRRHLRLAVRRTRAPARHSGQSVRHASCSAWCVALLVAQPDLGQTILVLGTWGVMFFMAGMPWLWIIALGAAGVGGAFAAYTSLPARGRPHRPLPDRRGRHVPGRHGPRGARSMAAGSASGRARARSSGSSPTAMPTSSSRWPARSSASCCASSSWPSSPSS